MQYRTKIFKSVFMAIGVTGLVIFISPLAARLLPDEISHQFSSHNHLDKNRFSEVGGDWPPQPNNMENIVWLQSNVAGRASSSRNSDTLATSLSADDVIELGDRFTYISTKSSAEKDTSSSKEIMIFFSHSNNTTVEVTVDQGVIGEVEQISPAKYQPPLTVEEVTDSVKIARESFQDEGVSRILELEGFSILAFKPSAELTSENGGFYETRVAYVSFHEDVDARPEFVAWVDLSEGTVIKSREDEL
jgi:hypothetical protein